MDEGHAVCTLSCSQTGVLGMRHLTVVLHNYMYPTAGVLNVGMDVRV